MIEVLRNFSALCLNQPVKTLSLGWARSSVAFPTGSLLVPLCWNMTCKYQTLALVTSTNTAHLRADASGKCLSLPQYVQCRLQADGKARPLLTLPTCTPDCVCWGQMRDASLPFSFFRPALCLCKANETLRPDVGVKLHSWANNLCLLYSMTCLKWHAGPKKGGDQLSSEERSEPQHSSPDRTA